MPFCLTADGRGKICERVLERWLDSRCYLPSKVYEVELILDWIATAEQFWWYLLWLTNYLMQSAQSRISRHPGHWCAWCRKCKHTDADNHSYAFDRVFFWSYTVWHNDFCTIYRLTLPSLLMVIHRTCQLPNRSSSILNWIPTILFSSPFRRQSANNRCNSCTACFETRCKYLLEGVKIWIYLTAVNSY
jgi:hypothetical protein